MQHDYMYAGQRKLQLYKNNNLVKNTEMRCQFDPNLTEH